MNTKLKSKNISSKLAIGASGSGSTFEAIAKAVQGGDLPYEVTFLFVDRNAEVVERAKRLGIRVITRGELEKIDDFHRRIVELAVMEGVDVIALAGYLRLFPVTKEDPFIVLNSHPGKIPDFGGQGMYGGNVHDAVLNWAKKTSFSDPYTYSTIHIASSEYDRGPVVGLMKMKIEESDNSKTLAARLLPIEHENYIESLRKIAENF